MTDEKPDEPSRLESWREDLQAQIDVIDAIQRQIDSWTSRALQMPAPAPISGMPVAIRFNADRAASRLQFFVYKREMPSGYIDLAPCLEYVCDNVAADSLETLEKMLRIRTEMDLPALTGTEKQIIWGNQIRLRVALLQPELITGDRREMTAKHWIDKFKEFGLQDRKRPSRDSP